MQILQNRPNVEILQKRGIESDRHTDTTRARARPPTACENFDFSFCFAFVRSSRLHRENLELRNELDIGPDEATPRQVINALTQSVETLGSTNDALAAALS